MFTGRELPPCSLGCHKITQTKKQFLVNIQDMIEPQRRLLLFRAKQKQDINTVRGHHYMAYLKYYTSHLASKWCSNPFLEHMVNLHRTAVITISLVDKCAFDMPVLDKAVQPAVDDLPVSVADAVNEAFVVIGASPVRRKRARGCNEFYIENKLKKLQKNMKQTMRNRLGLSDVSKAVSKIEPNLLNDNASLINQLKSKYMQETSRRNKIRILTVAPHSWSRSKIMRFFGAQSDRYVRQSNSGLTLECSACRHRRKVGP